LRKLFRLIFIFFLLSLFCFKYPILFIFLPLPLIFIKRKDFLIYYLIFIISGLIRIYFYKPPIYENLNEDSLIGSVCSFENSDSFVLKNSDGKFLIYKNENLNLNPYDKVKVEGYFFNDKSGNPGEDSFYLYKQSEKISGTFFGKNIEIIQKDNSILSKIRGKFYSNIKNLGISGEIIEGLILGGRGVESNIKEEFKYSGVLHLFAVSGLHISIIASFLSLFLHPFLVIFLLFIYLMIILFPVSAIRSFIMFSFYLLGKRFYREADSLNLLLFSAIILLLINPINIISPSFLLTFSSTLSIITIIEKFKNNFYKFFLFPLFINLGNFPILIYFFPFFSFTSFISNLIIIPIISLILPLLFFFVILSILINNILTILKPIFIIFYKIILFFSNFPSAAFGVKKPSVIFLILFFSLFFFFILYLNSNFEIKRFKPLFLILIISVIVSFLYPYISDFGKMRITFFDVGEGDSILIKTPNNKYILIDGGGTFYKEKSSPGIRVLNSLKRLGVNKIDLLIFTHEDSDHIEGLFHIIKREKIDYIGYPDIELSYYGKDLIDKLEIQNVKKINLKRGGSFKIEGLEFIILNPISGGKDYLRANDNNNSLCILLKYKNFSALLTGDIEVEAINDIYKLYPDLINDVTLLKVPHHGSKNSYDINFFNLIRPKYSIISVGPNVFGHPSDDILDLLSSINSEILRTDEDGAIEIDIIKNKIKINTYDFSETITNLFENRFNSSFSYPP